MSGPQKSNTGCLILILGVLAVAVIAALNVMSLK